MGLIELAIPDWHIERPVGGLLRAAADLEAALGWRWRRIHLDDVRIWDLDPSLLCDKHLLGEHRELHAIWSILTTGKRGYARHPETLRWQGRLAALYARHNEQVQEMLRRGFRHRSPLDAELATGTDRQTVYVDSPSEQRVKLARRGCSCRIAET